MILVERRKTIKTQERTNKTIQLYSQDAETRNQTWVALVSDDHSHRYDTHASQPIRLQDSKRQLFHKMLSYIKWSSSFLPDVCVECCQVDKQTQEYCNQRCTNIKNDHKFLEGKDSKYNVYIHTYKLWDIRKLNFIMVNTQSLHNM